MAEAAVVAPRDVREPAHLLRRQRSIRNVDAQHVGVELQVEAVLEPQGPELVFRELAAEPTRDLAAKLRDALRYELVIEFIVSIHIEVSNRRPEGADRLANGHRLRSSRLDDDIDENRVDD